MREGENEQSLERLVLSMAKRQKLHEKVFSGKRQTQKKYTHTCAHKHTFTHI